MKLDIFRFQEPPQATSLKKQFVAACVTHRPVALVNQTSCSRYDISGKNNHLVIIRRSASGKRQKSLRIDKNAQERICPKIAQKRIFNFNNLNHTDPRNITISDISYFVIFFPNLPFWSLRRVLNIDPHLLKLTP